MCRYAFYDYKQHMACFNCRKTFKRRNAKDLDPKDVDDNPAKCPQCAQPMANMGLDFESPKRDDEKTWKHIEKLYEVAITFHSCGCSGPGYIPRDHEQLKAYFENIIAEYQKNLAFWRNRVEPTNESEVQKEKNKHLEYTWKIPKELENKIGIIKNEDAIKYWIENILKVEERLRLL